MRHLFIVLGLLTLVLTSANHSQVQLRQRWISGTNSSSSPPASAPVEGDLFYIPPTSCWWQQLILDDIYVRIGMIDDVDGDGVNDVIFGIPEAGLPNSYSPTPDSGELRILSGRTGSLIRTHAGAGFTEGGWGTYNYYGYEMGAFVGGLGDWDGDGIGDYFGVAPQLSSSLSGCTLGDGYLRVYSGATGIWLAQATTRVALPGGDFNADGIRDLIFRSETEIRTVSGTSLATIASIPSGLSDITFASLGDTNGDGFDDFVRGVGFVNQGIPNSPPGWVRVHCGMTGALLVEIVSGVPNEYGAQVGSAGDWNQDGYADFAQVVKEYNGDVVAIEVRSGLDGTDLYQSTLAPHADARYVRIAGATDLDGDGWVELIVSGIQVTHIHSSATESIVATAPTGYTTTVLGQMSGDGLGRIAVATAYPWATVVFEAAGIDSFDGSTTNQMDLQWTAGTAAPSIGSLDLTQAPSTAPGALVLGFATDFVPYQGITILVDLTLAPPLFVPFLSDATGEFHIPGIDIGHPQFAGAVFALQALAIETSLPFTLHASNALLVRCPVF